MPTLGRGGAGNIKSKEEVEEANKQISADLERQQQSAEDYATTGYDNSQKEYAHMGRGGAGNFYSPAQLSKTGSFSAADRSSIFGDATLAPDNETVTIEGVNQSQPKARKPSMVGSAEDPFRRTGRGGAGNFVRDAEAEERERRQAEETREKVSEKVQQDVEAGLARPGRAYQGESRR